MTDEEKKEKYKNIVYRLRVINNKINNLNKNINSLENSMNKNLMVNNKIFDSDKIDSVKNNLNSASYSINGDIIPRLNRKIYY